MKGIILIAVLAVFGFSETTFAEKMSAEDAKLCETRAASIALMVTTGFLKRPGLFEKFYVDDSRWNRMTIDLKEGVARILRDWFRCYREPDIVAIYIHSMYSGKELAQLGGSWKGDVLKIH